MVEANASWLSLVALLGAVPLAGILLVRRGQPEALPGARTFGRWLFAYAAGFATLLLALRQLGVPGLMAAYALLLGFLGTRRGLGPLYRFLFGPAALEAYPELVARDAGRLHLTLFIGAVACITVGLVFATLPGLR